MDVVALALSIGILAGIWTYASGLLALLTWPAFIGWACFFATGGDVKSIPKAGAPVISGVILGWIGVKIAPVFGATLGVPIAITIIAIVMVLMIKIKGFEFAPGQFAGAATFFGAGADFVSALTPLIIGVLLGYLSAVLPKLVVKPQSKGDSKAT